MKSCEKLQALDIFIRNLESPQNKLTMSQDVIKISDDEPETIVLSSSSNECASDLDESFGNDESDMDLDLDEDDFNNDPSQGIDQDDQDECTSQGYNDEFGDTGFGSKKPWTVPYTVLSEEDLKGRQAQMIEKVASILQIPSSHAAALLHLFRWHVDSLVERYMEDSEKVLISAGLSPSLDTAHVSNAESGWMCTICCNESSDEEPLKIFDLACGHLACTDCYDYYLRVKISEEGQSREIPCIAGAKACHFKVDQQSIKELVCPMTWAKFLKNQIEAYVQECDHLKWCVAPECEYALECSVRKDELTHVVPSVACHSKHMFCFGCNDEEHQPTLCILAAKWRKKCADDSETANWISANTKDCPKCKAMIEKNGGCNHMTCRKCRYEFCWLCLGDWDMHGQSYYNCSRFDKGEVDDTERHKSRKELERYLHYYQRYATHQQSLKLDSETYAQLDAKMKAMQEEKGLTWIEAQYLKDAYETLRQCRHTLTWTYAFAFYLKPCNQTTIFEDNQRDLELATENLSELFEKPAREVAEKQTRMDVINKRAYVASRREVILEFAAKELNENAWDFTVSITK